MTIKSLQKWRFLCAVVVVISGLVELAVITMMMFSTSGNLALDNLSDTALKVLAYAPWVVMVVSSVVRLGLSAQIKTIESRNTDERIKELKHEVEQLKRK